MRCFRVNFSRSNGLLRWSRSIARACLSDVLYFCTPHIPSGASHGVQHLLPRAMSRAAIGREKQHVRDRIYIKSPPKFSFFATPCQLTKGMKGKELPDYSKSPGGIALLTVLRIFRIYLHTEALAMCGLGARQIAATQLSKMSLPLHSRESKSSRLCHPQIVYRHSSSVS